MQLTIVHMNSTIVHSRVNVDYSGGKEDRFMKNITIRDAPLYTRTEALCSLPIAPLGPMQYCWYPAPLFCAIHVTDTNHYISLILKGEMIYREEGKDALVCRRGDLVVIPKLCRYSWETVKPTFSFQCGHAGFSLCEYGKLSLLFGIGQKYLELIHLGEDFADDFANKIEAARKHLLKELYISVATFELLTNAAELFCARFNNEVPESTSELIKQYIYYIEKHLQGNITIAELAKFCNISRRSLFTLFKKNMNMTPLEYIAVRKIEFAKRLLSTTTLSCDEIAQLLGFSSANYFIRFFKKNTGTTPIQIRRQWQKLEK